MMLWYSVFTAVLCLSIITQPGHSDRILCVFPTPCLSHQVVYRGLTLELNKRGHELVVVTPNPINDATLTNYTEINTSFGEAGFNTEVIKNRQNNVNMLDWMQQGGDDRIPLFVDALLNNPKLKKLYAADSGEKFDLLIVEMTLYQGFYPLATRFDVPMIGILSLALNLNVLYAIGSPIMPSHPTNWELGPKISDQMSFWQRLQNFISVWKYLYWLRVTHLSRLQAVAEKNFGTDVPDLAHLEKNVSLIFVNQQAQISYARPNIPKVIEIGGFHIPKQARNMPEDLKEMLDNATKGFVYVSLGSTVHSSALHKETIRAFITAFSRLPYKVLWKFEDDSLPGKPDNVHIMKWVPQQAVLAHPNLKVFVYQGGVQSTEEAVHNAVPLVGLPVFGDQDMQINKMVSIGVAKKLEISTISGDELFDAISTVASDNSYKQKMLNLRSLINDKPYDPLENAVWWTEHVLRHRGAPHLHSTTADEPWYSRQDMDIVAFISAGSVVALGLILVLLCRLVKSICYIFSASSLDTKKRN